MNTMKDKNGNLYLKNNNLLRISVVVLDAENGDLLTSANYPLPDYKRLQAEEDSARSKGSKGARYNDYYKKHTSWKAYTDCDLGLVFQTASGSTAKILSAMAGLQKKGKSAASQQYLITKNDIIESGSAEEPYQGKFYKRHHKTVDKVDMWWAIVESSNCYFINLVNDNDLYQELGEIYESIGVRIGDITPYQFSFENIDEAKSKTYWDSIQSVRGRALDLYMRYKESGEHRKMNDGDWQWAWGQGTMSASPVNMARVASAVVNKGVMPVTQYVVSTNRDTKKLRKEQDVRLLSKANAAILRDLMKQESANQKDRNGVVLPNSWGGKTGTPERGCPERGKPDKKYNDGWYVFFVESDGCVNGRPLAVAVRLERGLGSGAAVRLSEAVVLKALRENGYIK